MKTGIRPSHLAAALLVLVGCEPRAAAPSREARAAPPAAASVPGEIERVATLASPRAAHTATLLPSGRLLVAGGMGPGGASLATAEILDGRTAAVAPAPSMTEARADHTATALHDGRVVIAGGFNGAYLASVEIYDPARERFETLGRLNVGRSGHTATLLPDGRILMIGGVGEGWSFLSSAEVFDPATGRSEPTGSLSVPRESHTATSLADGRVLVVGGHQGRRAAMEVYASAELYDPATRRFQPTGELGTARHKHEAVRLADGRVLVLGGADRTDRRHYATTEVYDPATGTFDPGPLMASARYKIAGTAVRLERGDVLVPAGARTAELLDPTSFTFGTVAGDLPEAYYFATATPLPNATVLIIGGYDGQNRTTRGVWRFRIP